MAGLLPSAVHVLTVGCYVPYRYVVTVCVVHLPAWLGFRLTNLRAPRNRQRPSPGVLQMRGAGQGLVQAARGQHVQGTVICIWPLPIQFDLQVDGRGKVSCGASLGGCGKLETWENARSAQRSRSRHVPCCFALACFHPVPTHASQVQHYAPLGSVLQLLRLAVRQGNRCRPVPAADGWGRCSWSRGGRRRVNGQNRSVPFHLVKQVSPQVNAISY